MNVHTQQYLIYRLIKTISTTETFQIILQVYNFLNMFDQFGDQMLRTRDWLKKRLAKVVYNTDFCVSWHIRKSHH